ncbi:hypothetical protein BFD21_23870 [Escherichia coli]|nr:hypothetical protein BFD21_23870 [Escherichia coli]
MICSPQNNTGAIMKKRNFSAEFKRESAQLRKKLQRIEMENEILKKATALLMSDSLNSSR